MNARKVHPVRMPKLHSLVAVRWLDSYVSAHWRGRDTQPECAECFSVGWLVATTPTAIQLSQTVSATEGCERAGLLSIPRGCLLAAEVLR